MAHTTNGRIVGGEVGRPVIVTGLTAASAMGRKTYPSGHLCMLAASYGLVASIAASQSAR
jgi:hypothetical protein